MDRIQASRGDARFYFVFRRVVGLINEKSGRSGNRTPSPWAAIVSAIAAILTLGLAVSLAARPGWPKELNEKFFGVDPPETCQDHPGLRRLDLRESDVVVTVGESSKMVDDKVTVATSPRTTVVTIPHDGGQATDYQPDSAWIPDGSEGKSSRGQSITIEFKKPVNLQLVCVLNGYARVDDGTVYQQNAKLRDVTLETKHGDVTSRMTTSLRNLPTESRFDYQEVNAMDGNTDQVTLIIDDYYPGEVKAGRREDVALSELEIWVST